MALVRADEPGSRGVRIALCRCCDFSRRGMDEAEALFGVSVDDVLDLEESGSWL